MARCFPSNYEYPGRYTRWDTAVIDPPVAISCHGRSMWLEAFNGRGEALLALVFPVLDALDEVSVSARDDRRIDLKVHEPERQFTEEERSKAPTVFTVLRAIVDLFYSEDDASLGLYGAFGYDLAFQFDAINLKLERPDDQRDMVLFLPDEVLMVDNHAAKALDRSL